LKNRFTLNCMNNICKKHVCEGEFFWHWVKVQKEFWKLDMHVIITIESTTIVSSIRTFQPKLIPMFFHMDLDREFWNFIQSWRSTTIVVIVIGVMGVGDNKVF
jgi:hypothetical protein